jgi:hypothetical protein
MCISELDLSTLSSFSSFSSVAVRSISSPPSLLRSAGVHQYIGNCCWILFNTHPTATNSELPSIISGSRNQPKAVISGDVAHNNAVAPAGGWIVFVMPMTAEATPTESAPAIQRRDSKCELCWNSFVMQMPIVAENIWPRTALRGWERGDSIAWYSRIAAAPCFHLDGCRDIRCVQVLPTKR